MRSYQGCKDRDINCKIKKLKIVKASHYDTGTKVSEVRRSTSFILVPIFVLQIRLMEQVITS